jgi:hypothetical protein
MMHRIIILQLSFLLISGCSKSTQPTQPISTSNDEILRTQIVGQWKCSSSWNFTFNSDTTFIDSLSFAVYSPDVPHYELWYVVKGKYSISNGLLTFPQMELVFADTTHLLPVNFFEYYVFYPSQVVFTNGNLVLNVMDVLSPVNGDGKSLNGNWETENWIVQIERRPNLMAFFGKIKKEYHFDESSFKYSLASTNSFGSIYQVANDSGSFTYTTNRLSFGSNITIPTFMNGDLLLNYISSPIFPYEKIK